MAPMGQNSMEPTFLALGELYYESFDRKRALVKYQSQSEVLKVFEKLVKFGF